MSLLDQYDAFLFDLDGTLLLGDKALPGAAEVCGRITRVGKPWLCLTNNPYLLPEEIADQLTGLNLDAKKETILTAGSAAAHLVRRHLGQDTLTFVMGSPALESLCTRQGLQVTRNGLDNVQAAVVGGFLEFTYEHLKHAAWAARHALLFAATNRDAVFPTPEGPWPGTGAIVAAVEKASGRCARIAGKPESPMFELARERVGEHLKILMIGDNPETDIAGGKMAGMGTALVLTGNAARIAPENLPGMQRPDHVCPSLFALME